MQRIYCISGLGADHSLFQRLSIPGCELLPLHWEPYAKTDDMRSYAAKMAAKIPDENAVVIGLSFGGMLATEIAKMHPFWKIFLVSSAKTAAELGFNNGYINRIVKWISKAEIIPSYFLCRPNPISLSMLGVRTAEEKKLIKNVMRHSDPEFYRWSFNTILHWNNRSYSSNVTHIHGTQDKIIRSVNVHPDHWIGGGSHIMIYNHAAEVSKIISDCLSK